MSQDNECIKSSKKKAKSQHTKHLKNVHNAPLLLCELLSVCNTDDFKYAVLRYVMGRPVSFFCGLARYNRKKK